MFYTYYHTRNDTQKPFYVEKGSGNRAFDADRNKHWKSIVAKHGHTVHIAAEWPTENEAFEHEKFLILCFKDIGIPLCNRTAGGEGTTGWVPTDENRKVTSRVTKERWADHEYKARVSESIRRGAAVPGVSEKRSLSVKAALAKPEAKRKLSDAQKRLWQDPAHREKVLASRAANKETDEAKELRIAKSTAAKRTSEAREKTSMASKAMWSNPEFKIKAMQAIANSITPEALEKQSRAMRDRWQDQSYVEKVMEGRANGRKLTKDERHAMGKANWENPEYVEKMKTAMLATRTEEAIQKRRESMKALWQDPVYLAKMKSRSAKK